MTCGQCGESFEAKGDWMRLCWRCWREQKQREALVNEYRRGYVDGYEAGSASRPTLDSGLLRDLVSLCHPDRHPAERAKLANRATAALIGMRQ